MKKWNLSGPTTTSELTFNSNNQYKIVNLKPNTKYMFSVAYHTDMGITQYGKPTEPILTKPCSPPSNVQQTTKLAHSVKITWDTPLSIGKGVTIESYSYTLKAGKLSEIEKASNLQAPLRLP